MLIFGHVPTKVMNMISSIIVVGGGTAGLISALSLRIKLPDIAVTVIRSKELGVIGVGEGTVGAFGDFFFKYLGLDRAEFYQQTNATWKLGIKFNWGRASDFNYCFSPNCDWKWDNQRYPNGFYTGGEYSTSCQNSALMDTGKGFVKLDNDDPLIDNSAAFHLENKLFVDYLENQASMLGVTLIDARIGDVTCSDQGVDHLTLVDGTIAKADFYVDASGFRSLLLEKGLQVPFDSFDSSLFCDRAMIGAWQRTDETILPYTTSDTMNSGWSWRIDHEHHINRGYVYSSSFISGDDAEDEFRQKNPKLDQLNHISFAPGKHRHSWVGNVVAIGNAYGFVEPLEATSILLICLQSRRLVESLSSSHRQPNDAVRLLYNDFANEIWESSRRFLALHYKLNNLLSTPFWKHCQEKTELGEVLAKMVAFYRAYGPDNELLRTYLPPDDVFGVDGYLAIMTGLGLSYDQSRVTISADDWHNWQQRCQHYRQQAEFNSASVKEALQNIRSPEWKWY